MKILIAPNPEDVPLHVWPAGSDRHEVLQLAAGSGTHGAERSSTPSGVAPAHSWQNLLDRCPPGWTPDVYICWSLEYRPVPEGIEDADCFTVGVIGDWNLGGQAMQEICGAFDLLVADRNGCDRLRALGFENVLYWPLWAYDPRKHYLMPEAVRDLDVVMVGSFNHHIQRERARWLGRIARMSRRWRVAVATGVFGEEYTRVLNRSRIVFNRSIRGEINMRVYEAAACGALLFYERENREIASVLKDREECVLYGEDDLEELIEHYLTHENERAAAAAGGHRAISRFTYAEQAAGLFEAIAEWRRSIGTRGRLCERQTRDERSLGRVRQWITVFHSADLARAEKILAGVMDASTDVADRHKAQSCLLGFRALQSTDPQDSARKMREALSISRWQVKLRPQDAAACVNAGELALSCGEEGVASDYFQSAVRLLKSPHLTEGQVTGPYYPRAYDAYTAELERLHARRGDGGTAWSRQVGDLLAWRSHSRLAEISRKNDAVTSAAEHARIAASLQPDLAPSWQLLARCHRDAGQLPEAATAYRRAYDLVPLDPQCWLEHIEVLSALGAGCDLSATAEDMLALIDGCPNLEHLRESVVETCRSNSTPVRTLLAAPEWGNEDHWRALILDFVRTFRYEGEATLAILVDPAELPDLNSLAGDIERHLEAEAGIPASEWPDLHLIHLSPEEADRDFASIGIDAVCPPPLGPPSAWRPDIPRMTVQSFRLAAAARALQSDRLAA